MQSGPSTQRPKCLAVPYYSSPDGAVASPTRTEPPHQLHICDNHQSRPREQRQSIFSAASASLAAQLSSAQSKFPTVVSGHQPVSDAREKPPHPTPGRWRQSPSSILPLLAHLLSSLAGLHRRAAYSMKSENEGAGPKCRPDGRGTMPVSKAAWPNMDWMRDPPPPTISKHESFVRSATWDDTPIGPMESWPSTLKTIVRLMMPDTNPTILLVLSFPVASPHSPHV